MQKTERKGRSSSPAEYIVVLLAYVGIYAWNAYSYAQAGLAGKEVAQEDIPAHLIASIGTNLALFVGFGLVLMLLFNKLRVVQLTLAEQTFLSSIAWIALFVLLLTVLQRGVDAAFHFYGSEQIEAPIVSALEQYFHSPWMTVVVGTPVMFLVAGVPEEFMRCYAIANAIRLHNKVLVVLSIVVTSAAFALGHLYQGNQAMIQLLIVGLVFGIAYAARPSLWTMVFMHTTYNVVGLLLPTLTMQRP